MRLDRDLSTLFALAVLLAIAPLAPRKSGPPWGCGLAMAIVLGLAGGLAIVLWRCEAGNGR